MQDAAANKLNLLTLWAKTKKIDNNVRHPLLFHMIDTACVAQVMWKISFGPALRMRLAEPLGLTDDEAGIWIPFLIGLHDIGKASPLFQSKNLQSMTLLKKAGMRFPIGLSEPHGVLTRVLLSKLLSPLFDTSTCPNLCDSIATALGGHHGRFPCDTGKSMRRELGMVDGSTAWCEARASLLNAYRKSFNVSFDLLIAKPVDSAFLLLLAGFTSVADWIASSEQFFPYVSTDAQPAEYVELARKRAKAAIESLGWHHPDTLVGFPEFTDIYQFVPRPLQNTTAAIAKEISDPGLVLVEAPMGEGKTEAAIHLAESWLRKLGQQGCYIAMPTMATANGMFGRFLNDYLSKVRPSDATGLRLIHGQAAISDTYRQFRVASVYDSDQQSDVSGDINAEDWFAYKKRGLLSSYGIGTIDQALLSVLQVKHCFVRLLGLAGKTIIIDEVHAYDVYTREILESLLQWLKAIGSSVVLLSATLPKTTRDRLVRVYGGDTKQSTEYPRVTSVINGKTECKHIPSSSTARDVTVKWLEDDDNSLADRLLAAINDGGCAAYVCNTVAIAQSFYKVLQETLKEHNGDLNILRLFHARHPFKERDEREKKLVQEFGKDAGKNGNLPRPPQAILVATQVIEQSLDLDFDLMVTDLAPVDLILQRSGRMFRHKGTNRHSFKRPELWIRTPPNDNNGCPDFTGSKKVYPEYTRLRTMITLGSNKGDFVFKVPEDVEDLVEKVYDDSKKIGVPEHMAACLCSAKADLNVRIEQLRNEALKRLIKLPSFEPGLSDVINGDLEENAPTAHKAFQAPTRWSDLPSVSLICLHEKDGSVFLDSGCTETVDLDNEPDENMLCRLMRREMRLSGHAITEYFVEQSIPHGWAKVGMLRHHRLAIFKDGVLRGSNFTLRLDPDLGGVIEYDKTREESDEY